MRTLTEVNDAITAALQVNNMTVLPPLRMMTIEGAVLCETPEDYERWLKEVSEQRLEAVKAAARQAGVACETVFLEHDEPYQGVIDVARDKGCDLIVMASHGRRGLSRLLIGSQANQVVVHSDVPVLVVR